MADSDTVTITPEELLQAMQEVGVKPLHMGWMYNRIVGPEGHLNFQTSPLHDHDYPMYNVGLVMRALVAQLREYAPDLDIRVARDDFQNVAPGQKGFDMDLEDKPDAPDTHRGFKG